MNLFIQCEIALSKKLQSLLEPGEPVSLYIMPDENGRYLGQMRLVSRKGVSVKQLRLEEASILLYPIEVGEEAPDLHRQQPASSLFTAENESARMPPEIDGAAKVVAGQAGQETFLQAKIGLAVTDPGRHPAGGPAGPEANVPDEEKKIARQAVRNWVHNYEELLREVDRVPGVDEPVPPAPTPKGARLSRQEAVQSAAIRSNAPRLRKACYLSNEADGILELAGFGQMLKRGAMVDLTRFPARQIRDSLVLQQLIEKGYLAFRSPSEYHLWMDHYDPDQPARSARSTLKVYDNVSQAKAAIADPGAVSCDSKASRLLEDAAEINMDEVDLGEPPVAESPEMDDLVRQMPLERAGDSVAPKARPRPASHSGVQPKTVRRSQE